MRRGFRARIRERNAFVIPVLIPERERVVNPDR